MSLYRSNQQGFILLSLCLILVVCLAVALWVYAVFGWNPFRFVLDNLSAQAVQTVEIGIIHRAEIRADDRQYGNALLLCMNTYRLSEIKFQKARGRR